MWCMEISCDTVTSGGSRRGWVSSTANIRPWQHFETSDIVSLWVWSWAWAEQCQWLDTTMKSGVQSLVSWPLHSAHTHTRTDTQKMNEIRWWSVARQCQQSVQALYWYLGLGHSQATAPHCPCHWSNHTDHIPYIHAHHTTPPLMSHRLQPDIRPFSHHWHHPALWITPLLTSILHLSLKMGYFLRFWIFSCNIRTCHLTHTRLGVCPAPCLTGLLSTRPSQRAGARACA